MENPDSLPNWSVFTERIGNEAIFSVVQWIAGRPILSTDCKSLKASPDGDYAEFSVPIIGVMPLLPHF